MSTINHSRLSGAGQIMFSIFRNAACASASASVSSLRQWRQVLGLGVAAMLSAAAWAQSPVDLVITKAGPSAANNRSAITYTLTIGNNGPASADGATFSDPLPAGFTNISASCGSMTGGAVCPTTIAISGTTVSGVIPTLPYGGQLVITINGTTPLTGAVTISNTATITAPAGTTETNPSTNSSKTNTTIAYQSADLVATKTTTTPGPFTSFPYTLSFTVNHTNNGPGAADGSRISDSYAGTVPAGSNLSNVTVSGLTVTCVATSGAVCPTMPAVVNGNIAAVSGNIYNALTVPTWPASGNLAITVTMTVTGYVNSQNPACGSTPMSWSMTNTATSTIQGAGLADSNSANNSQAVGPIVGPTSAAQTACPNPTMQVQKEQSLDGSTWTTASISPAFGQTVYYRMTYINTGTVAIPSSVALNDRQSVTATNVTVNFRDQAVVSCVGTGGAVCPASINLPASGSIAGGGSATSTLTTGPTIPAGGSLVIVSKIVFDSYTTTCGNSASAVFQNRVSTSNPAATTVPSGVNSVSATLPNVAVNPCPTVDLAAVINSPANNNPSPLPYDTWVPYTVTFTNNGPIAINNSTANINFGNVSPANGPITTLNAQYSAFTCTPTSGAACPSNWALRTGWNNVGSPFTGGAGVIPFLPVGGSITVTFNAMFEPSNGPTTALTDCDLGAVGNTARAVTVRLTATITAPTGFTETNAANNNAQITSGLTPTCIDLSIAKAVSGVNLPVGSLMAFTIDVSAAASLHPVTVPNITMSDVLPAGFAFDVNASNAITCTVVTPGTGPTATVCPTAAALVAAYSSSTREFAPVIPSLGSGGSVQFVLNGTAAVQQPDGSLLSYGSSWYNEATLTKNNPHIYDPNLNTNTSRVSFNLTVAEPSLNKRVQQGSQYATPGGTVQYVITLSNPSSAAQIDSASITDTLPNGWTYASTVSIQSFGSGVSRTTTLNPTAGDTSPTWGSWSVPAGGSVVITFNVTVPQAALCGATVYSNSAVVNYSTGSVSGSRSYQGDLIGNTLEDVLIPCAPTVTKVFSTPSLISGQTTLLTFTITPDASGVSFPSDFTFTDTFPSGLEIAGTASGTCLTPATGSQYLNDTGGVLAAGSLGVLVRGRLPGTAYDAQTNTTINTYNQSCTVTVPVRKRAGITAVNPVCGDALADDVPFTNGPSQLSGLTNVVNGVSNQCLTVTPGQLTLTKAFPVSFFLQGTTTNATFTVSNPATNPADVISFTETLPPGLTFAAPATVGGTCTSAGYVSVSGGIMTVTNLPIAANATAAPATCTIIVPVTNTAAGVASTVACVPYLHTNGAAQITAMSPNLAPYTSTPCVFVMPYVTLNKTLNPTVIVTGDISTLTFTVTQSSTNVSSTAIGFTDALPTNWRIATSNVSNTCGGTLTDSANVALGTGATSVKLVGGSVATGATSCQITVEVTNASGTSNSSCSALPAAWTNNNSRISGGTANGQTSAFTAAVNPAQCMVVVNTDPQISKAFNRTGTSVGQATIIAGNSTDVSLTISNPTNVVMDGFELVDVLPAPGDTTFSNVSRGSTTSGALSGPITGLPAGVTVYYSTVANPCRSTAQGVNLGGTTANLPTGCTAPAWATSVGDYTLVSALRFVGSGLAIAANGGTMTLAFPITVAAAASSGQTLDNDVMLAMTTGGQSMKPVASNVAEIVVITPTPTYLSPQKIASSTMVASGGSFTYTIRVNNTGDTASGAAQVVDNVPAGVSITAALPSNGWSCAPTSVTGPATITCDKAAPGVAGNTFNETVVTLSATKTQVDAVTNSVTITAGDSGCALTPVPTRCTGSVTVNGVPALSVGKVASTPSTPSGTNFTYDITVSNAGATSPAYTIVTDSVPSGVNITGLTAGAGWSCTPNSLNGPGSIACTKAAGVGGGVSGELVATLSAVSVSNSAITNGAAITSGDPACSGGSAPARCAASVTTVPGTPSLTAMKYASLSNYDNVAGGAVTYTVVITNAGNAPASGVIVDDAAPSQIGSWLSMTCAASSGSVCGVTTPATGHVGASIVAANGGTITVTLVGSIAANSTGTLVNTATVTSPACLASSCSPTISVPPITPPDGMLVIEKTVDRPTYQIGTNVTYSVVVKNPGTSAISGIVLTDSVPASLTGVVWSCAPNCTPANGVGNNVNITSLNLAADQSAVLTVSGTVQAGTTGVIRNSAALTPPTGASCTPLVSGSCVVSVDLPPAPPVGTPAAISVVKLSPAANYVPGQSVTYTIRVGNVGGATSAAFSVVDAIPAGLTSAAWACAACIPSSGSGNVSTTVAALAPGAFTDISISATALITATTAIQNTASVTPGGGDGCVPVTSLSPLSCSNMVTLPPATLVAISGRVYREGSSPANTADNGNAVDPGLITNVSISCTNPAFSAGPTASGADGSYSFTGVPAGATCTITETQPAGYTNAYNTQGAGGTSNTGGAAGSSGDSSITLTVPAAGSTGNNFAEQSADMVSTTTCAPNPANPGQATVCTITCTNNGPGAAVGATCNLNSTLASLPAGATTTCPSAATTIANAGNTSCTVNFNAPLTGSVTVAGGAAATNDSNGGNVATAGNNASTTTLNVNTVSISGRVYREGSSPANTADNGNAVDPGLITNVSISCTNPAFSAGPTASGADGSYSFTGVPAGATCTITETQPAGYTNAYNTQGTGGTSNTGGAAGSSGDSSITLTVPAAGSTGNNFAEQSADMVPTFGNLPAAVAPAVTYTGLTLTCTNNGPGAAVSASCVPSTLTAGASVSNVVCVTTGGAPTVGATAPNNTIVCTFSYTTPDASGGVDSPTQAISLTGTTGASNDSNGGATSLGNNQTTVTRPVIDAVDDAISAQQYSLTGSVSYPVLINDQLGAAVNPSVGAATGLVTVSIVNNGGLTGASIDGAGNLVIPNNVPIATYTVIYQICTPTGLAAPQDKACDSASKVITFQGADMISRTVCSPGQGAPGTMVTCTVTCTNVGPFAATNAFCSMTNAAALPGAPTPSCPGSPTATLAVAASLSCTVSFPIPITSQPLQVFGGAGADNDLHGGASATAVDNNASSLFVYPELPVPVLGRGGLVLLALALLMVAWRRTRRLRTSRAR